MKYLIAVAFFFFTLNCHAQFINSVEFKGGLHDTKGASTQGYNLTLQLKHNLSQRYHLYAVAANYWWDRNVVNALAENKIFSSYNESDHRMYLLGFGLRRVMDTVKTLSFFLEMEIGVSYISYYVYNNYLQEVDGKPIYLAAIKAGEVNEYSFLAGFGAGIVHHLNENLSLVVEFKLNAFKINGESLTNYMVMSGFNFGL
ncbi:hypothetical protein [Melioribacter sp. OK-6-Me]|uniref:hypothetical protein n=1 Tax=unclassified Melioribacter TaxID=2627329 RepID=UPI003EDB5EB2